jgi:hypothetical protein
VHDFGKKAEAAIAEIEHLTSEILEVINLNPQKK